MIHSMWYLDNLDRWLETPMRIVEEAREPTEVTMVGEVEFNIDNGPSVKVPAGLPAEEEAALAFSALPDIRSQQLTREAFIFANPTGYFHVAFIQAKCGAAKRGYVQKSVFVRCNALVPGLPRALTGLLGGPAEYTAEYAAERLIQVDLSQLGNDTFASCDRPGEFAKIAGRHRKIILENLLRGKSFLVLGSSPTEVSEAVCSLALLAGFRYGGRVVPYQSSFVPNGETKNAIIGGTNEHLFNKDEFDNVVVLAQGKYFSKFAKCSDEGEAFLALFEQYFANNPLGFRISKFMEQLSAQNASLRIKRLFREFFVGKNFPSWLAARGYRLQEG